MQVRVDLLSEYLTTQHDDSHCDSVTLIGSSMGGYVSTVVSSMRSESVKVDGLFLLCPALFMPFEECTVQAYQPKCDHIEIVHGWDDDIVPYENGIQFGKQTKAVVNLVEDGHRLSESVEFICERLHTFLSE